MAGKKYEENEDTVMWREHKKDIQDQHAQWKLDNTNLIKESGLNFRSTSSGECLVFRGMGSPMVDFYPSTGRWRDVKNGQVFSGGAKSFIHWYKKHENK